MYLSHVANLRIHNKTPKGLCYLKGKLESPVIAYYTRMNSLQQHPYSCKLQ